MTCIELCSLRSTLRNRIDTFDHFARIRINHLSRLVRAPGLKECNDCRPSVCGGVVFWDLRIYGTTCTGTRSSFGSESQYILLKNHLELMIQITQVFSMKL
jgi:hypothetical protein